MVVMAAGALAAPAVIRSGAWAQESTPATAGSATPGAAETFFAGTPAARRGEVVTIYSGRNENLVGPFFTALDAASGIDLEVR